MINAASMRFTGFPVGARGKWYNGNFRLLCNLGLLKNQQEKVA